MEVFYLKINRNVPDTIRYLLAWLQAISKIPNAKAYIICDKPELTNFIKATINFSGLDCEFMESNRTSPELQYIVDSGTITGRWKFIAYALLTPFLHARDMGYKDFWNIDADDIKLYISPERIAELLTAAKTYANENKINLFSLDICTTWYIYHHWTFGVVYTDNSVDWINLMREHCKDAYLFERYGHVVSTINLDWFCTYLREINAAKIRTFYFENLRMVHDTGSSYINPFGSIIYWKKGKIRFSVFENYDDAASEFGSLSIPDEVIRLDIGLRAEEATDTLKKDMRDWQLSRFEYEYGLNIFVSIILPITKSNGLSTHSLSSFLSRLLNQSLGRYELIAVDNGSNPDYMNAVESLQNPFFPRLKVLQSDSSDIFEMCNEGLRAAKGKYVLFTSGDDLFLDDFLQSLYSLAEQNQADVLYPFKYAVPLDSNANFDSEKDVQNLPAKFITDEKPWEFKEAAHELNDRNLVLRLQGFLNGVFYPSAFNKLIRREFLIDNDIKFSPDTSEPQWIFCLKCLCLAEKYIRIPQVLYVQLQKKNFEMEPDLVRKIESAEELEKFMARMNFFNNDVKLCKAILSHVLKK